MATPAPATLTVMLDHIEVTRLRESKMNPRRHFAGLDELTASVKQHGVLTPLLVRSVSDGNTTSTKYEIIAGARRYRAAKAAGIDSLPVRVLDLDDAQALEFQVIENLQREDVHPLDEALGYQALLKAGKHDIASIAAKVNKSESYVYQRLKLAALIPEAQKAFLEDKITAGHAILIARLQPQEQKQLLTEQRNEEMSVRAMAGYIEESFHLALGKAPWALDDDKLVPAAGSCVSCPKRTGANPKLFPDVKQKDTCTDPSCYREKLIAQVGKNAAEDLVSIAAEYQPSYGEKRIPGILYRSDYELAGTKGECGNLKDAIVVKASSYERAQIGARVKVCISKKCKIHGSTGYSSSRGISTMTPAQKIKQRKERAIGEARTEAVRQIAVEVKWPLSEDRARVIAAALLSRTNFDSQKLLCKALGVWPKDGKTGGFDFRGKARTHLAGLDKNGLAGFLMAAASVPEWGRWGGGYEGDAEEVKRLNQAAAGTGISVKKLEGQHISAANAKATKSKVAKSQTSAKKKAAARGKK